ncbi:acyl-CoA thioester hydrolase/BAAT C-terminal domain-containing protein [Natronococcus sp. A-GB7]|uniref:acyl-CoA thioester hydrolase/BAAT C-terminal domain-containing protein n=1 Tax=Natronococcus sp. A-GB7 TaxID=3037649 RepID=UPI00241DC726|nr:acyl-CoA thioester hydrolase/BAAT C-terminal domain-containing protein [Natronococcus sp. A-GB7]MDG5820281.1 acyl-CoA thioester hydrolase/BAAT C-terminal domain-containing protein [Natronococcus sp. A-GB7]
MHNDGPPATDRGSRRVRSRRQVLALLGGTASVALTGGTLPADESPTVDHPAAVRVDEPIELTVRGVPAGSELEVVLDGEYMTGETFGAAVTVEAETPTLSLNEAPIVGGDVPAGLDVPTTGALIQFADIPWAAYAGAAGDPARWPPETSLTYHVVADDRPIGALTLSRWHPVTNVVEPAGDLVGRVFEPSSGGSGPGVLVLHGADGTPQEHVAALLARHGFTAFALEYVSGPALSEAVVEVPMAYVKAAIDWLRDRERVAGDRIGVWGVGRGGELGLFAGSLYDGVGAVVSVGGSGVLWEGGAVRGPPAGTAAWAVDDSSRSYLSVATGESADRPTRYAEALAAAGELEAETATIPVERIDGPVLLVSGDDDEVWPSARLHALAADRLEARDHPSFEHLRYADAGRQILQPYLPLRGTAGPEYGGTLAGNAEAAHAHWPRVLGTLSTLT